AADRGRYGRHEPRRLSGAPAFPRAHDDDVDVGAEGANAVLEALALHFRRRRRVANLARTNAEDVAGVVERQKRSRGRLREVEHRAARGQQALEKQRAGLQLGHRADLRRELAELVQQSALETARIDDFEKGRACTPLTEASLYRLTSSI